MFLWSTVPKIGSKIVDMRSNVRHGQNNDVVSPVWAPSQKQNAKCDLTTASPSQKLNECCMKAWKCQAMYTMWWGHYVGFLRTYFTWIYKHNFMPMHSPIQHLEHSTHEHMKWECRLWMPLCNVANGYQRFSEHMASIFRVEIRNSSGPFPSDCHLFIRLHSSVALSFSWEMMQLCITVL
jgi:hypothetical protein